MARCWVERDIPERRNDSDMQDITWRICVKRIKICHGVCAGRDTRPGQRVGMTSSARKGDWEQEASIPYHMTGAVWIEQDIYRIQERHDTHESAMITLSMSSLINI